MVRIAVRSRMSQSVERAIQVLEMLSQGPQRVQDLAERLDVHRTTAFRLLADLEKGGLARRNDDGSYSVGYRLAGLARAAIKQFDLRSLARGHLTSLSRDVGLAVHIAMINTSGAFYADKVEAGNEIAMYSDIGKPIRLTASAVGKVLLAHLPTGDRDRIVANYPIERYTPTTITSREQILVQLDLIAKRGWGVDNGEYESVNCLAVPVRDAAGRSRIAVSITAPASMYKVSELLDHLPRLQAAADAVSLGLGGEESPNHAIA